nr:unnamed protein product [Rangifer tarandus platyrhynchus]
MLTSQLTFGRSWQAIKPKLKNRSCRAGAGTRQRGPGLVGAEGNGLRRPLLAKSVLSDWPSTALVPARPPSLSPWKGRGTLPPPGTLVRPVHPQDSTPPMPATLPAGEGQPVLGSPERARRDTASVPTPRGVDLRLQKHAHKRRHCSHETERGRPHRNLEVT